MGKWVMWDILTHLKGKLKPYRQHRGHIKAINKRCETFQHTPESLLLYPYLSNLSLKGGTINFVESAH
ncbi:hypothetical protein F0562_018705 [Nyssa sinensis]|uniref:Uncharacterized protein n=1 Tax=Nyssa sinensis TaxID=561372 RepID=A0A5J4ZD26_9ASTE|nr:hypothetical protein F0562_018705 [Nyssa sinensis]